jgi:hypothetical protein
MLWLQIGMSVVSAANDRLQAFYKLFSESSFLESRLLLLLMLLVRLVDLRVYILNIVIIFLANAGIFTALILHLIIADGNYSNWTEKYSDNNCRDFVKNKSKCFIEV